MARYHINHRNGKVGECRAQKSCPFGDLETDHYKSAAEARVQYEASMSNATLSMPRLESRAALKRKLSDVTASFEALKTKRDDIEAGILEDALAGKMGGAMTRGLELNAIADEMNEALKEQKTLTAKLESLPNPSAIHAETHARVAALEKEEKVLKANLLNQVSSGNSGAANATGEQLRTCVAMLEDARQDEREAAEALREETVLRAVSRGCGAGGRGC